MTTEALIFLGELDPEAIGPGLEFATHYEATPPADIDRVLDALPLAPERTTLVDLGSGMGRVVLHAARRPFRRIVGVEISPALHAVASENRASYRGPIACADVRLVRGDAATFRFPAGDLAVYLYNPFRAEVLGPVLDRLATGRRQVVLLYHTPIERALVEAHPAFEPIGAAGPAILYARRRELHAGRRMLPRA